MITLRYRLVKLGLPENPVLVCVLREEAEGIPFSDFNSAVPIEYVPLEAIGVEHLPASMIALSEGGSVTLLPVQEATGKTTVEAMRRIAEAARRAYGSGGKESAKEAQGSRRAKKSLAKAS